MQQHKINDLHKQGTALQLTLWTKDSTLEAKAQTSKLTHTSLYEHMIGCVLSWNELIKIKSSDFKC